MTLDELFEQKCEVAKAVLEELEKVMGAYGYNIEQILMVDIIPDPSVRKAMNEINAGGVSHSEGSSYSSTRWSAIATRLLGRTNNEIKNYWNTHLKKKLLLRGIDPMTNRRRIDLDLLGDLPKLLAASNFNNFATPWDNQLILLGDDAQLVWFRILQSLVQAMSMTSGIFEDETISQINSSCSNGGDAHQMNGSSTSSLVSAASPEINHTTYDHRKLESIISNDVSGDSLTSTPVDAWEGLGDLDTILCWKESLDQIWRDGRLYGDKAPTDVKVLKERLYQEFQEVCGPEKLICGPKKLTEEHLPKFPYLNVLFHETLRYHTHVPIITPRHVHEDTELGGYNILSYITIDLFACNMDRNVWDKPNVWDPERFLSAKSDMQDPNKTMDFGGVRVCVGSSLAMLISTTTMGRFVQEFHWRL